MAMSKKKTMIAIVTGGLFAVTIGLVTGFNCMTWQFWVILLAGVATKLPELFD
jgi:hypothetical protein